MHGRTGLARRLGAFDATLIVMGGIIGTGIFMNPSVVAARVHGAGWIYFAWIFGGAVALAGAFVFAELAARRPNAGGLYGYMRDAYHPALAFMYGWTALLVSQSGGMAAAAVTVFAYLHPFGVQEPAWLVALVIIGVLSAVNCLGVREGGTAQNGIMLLKAAAIIALVIAGFSALPHIATHTAAAAPAPAVSPFALLAMFGAALVPVFYSYDGWQTASVMDAELKDSHRTLPIGLICGVIVVVALYLAVTAAGLRMLGAQGLAATTTPASDIVRYAAGHAGALAVAAAVALSSLGFLSNQILVSPRIYHAMAADGLFFKQLACVHPRTKAPIAAILLQSAVAIVIASTGKYDQILNYVTSMDFIFLTLAAGAIFIFRRRYPAQFPLTVPGHPWTTLFFMVASTAVVISTLIQFPRDTLIGIAILLSGIPVYAIWRRRSALPGRKVTAP